LIGGDGDDVLNGGAGDDFLFGQAGADRFVFDDGYGRDVVKDFTPDTDLIDLSQHSLVFSLLNLVILQVGANTEITVVSALLDKIVLADVTASDLDAGDFLF
jgi:Ca2+-binding RTX toxin-like protein